MQKNTLDLELLHEQQEQAMCHGNQNPDH